MDNKIPDHHDIAFNLEQELTDKLIEQIPDPELQDEAFICAFQSLAGRLGRGYSEEDVHAMVCDAFEIFKDEHEELANESREDLN